MRVHVRARGACLRAYFIACMEVALGRMVGEVRLCLSTLLLTELHAPMACKGG
jgi:hypothetical protein